MHKVEIELTKYTPKVGLYRVLYHGQVLVESARTPAFAACRALLARGVTGKLAVYSVGGVEPRMTMDIERAAGFTISESEKQSLMLAPFREFVKEEEPEPLAA
jgi:hypothetical protein